MGALIISRARVGERLATAATNCVGALWGPQLTLAPVKFITHSPREKLVCTFRPRHKPSSAGGVAFAHDVEQTWCSSPLGATSQVKLCTLQV